MNMNLVSGVTGLVLLAVGIFLWSRTRAKRKAMKEWKAVITRIESHERVSTNDKGEEETDASHDVYIAYDYEGKHYEREMSHYSSGMYEGKEVKIFINPDNPSDISAPGDIFLSLGLTAFGALLLFFGLYGFPEP